MEYYDVFISYKRDGGSVWASLLYAILTDRYHLKVFMDVECLHGGEWDPQLEKAIKFSSNVIAVLHKGIEEILKVKNDVFLKEIYRAYKKSIPIIPFYAEGTTHEEIEKDKLIPTKLKKILKKHHGRVEYNHENTRGTFNHLFKLLNLNLLVEVRSCDDKCSMRYNINNEPPREVIKIDKGCAYFIPINRWFKGYLHIVLYTDKDDTKSYTINIGIPKQQTHDHEQYEWDPQKIHMKIPVNWQLHRRNVEITAFTNKSYNPVEDAIYNYLKLI